MAAHAAHKCTQNNTCLIISTLSLISLCAKRKICVQTASFVCKTTACVQSVCKFVQAVCRFVVLCAVCNYLKISVKAKCVQLCAVVCSDFLVRARAHEKMVESGVIA